ncbi:hypothetical protein RR46_09811 [Papilio xuthus]|uniref:Uncharacterized protein n=1 Tax=Papilio xuthus TaxID=66420 RepID=A0A194QAP6_PAPXU|nr:hypothetical protein RR46_09811 [Papilio xuthus]
MTDIKKPVKERLYLDRGQREVYVDTCDLAQHQIEGIRFLYRQYIKKKPGVILNNPDGYGKSIQLAFFLDAIRELLTNPVLILCEDENKKDVEMFNSIYSWLYSEKKFDINKYIDSISDVEGLPLARAKLLNSFLEDIVIIKDDFTPSKKPELIQEKISPKIKVSRKNKDATGTKIKRSKKTIESDSATDGNNYLDNFNTSNGFDTFQTNQTHFEPNIDSNKDTNSKQNCKINDNMYETTNFGDDGLDVENFIKQKEPVQCEEYDFLNESNSTDTENLSFTNALNDVVENENDLHSESILDEQSINVKNENIDEIKNDSLPTSVSSKIKGTDTDKMCTDLKTADVLKKNNKKDIIQAIAEMEEQAMKKFKNTVLDDLF